MTKKQCSKNISFGLETLFFIKQNKTDFTISSLKTHLKWAYPLSHHCMSSILLCANNFIIQA